ncbi:hypothetical protein HK096_003091 [Nowakowskiella sp. JEL0078]|nr:hypothetical protein HK096_003091 [Nowakowskiella sp. JEL0078]
MTPIPRIVIVVVCEDVTEIGIKKLIENKRAYAIRYGYEFLVFESEVKLGDLLDTGRFDWIWQLDVNTLITNFEIPIHLILPQNWYASTLPAPTSAENQVFDDLFPTSTKIEDLQIIVGVACTGMTTGSTLYRNSPYTRALLHHIQNSHPIPNPPLNSTKWPHLPKLRHLYEVGTNALEFGLSDIQSRRIAFFMQQINAGRERAEQDGAKGVVDAQEFQTGFEGRVGAIVRRLKTLENSGFVGNGVKARVAMVETVPERCVDAGHAWREGDFVLHLADVEQVESECRCCFDITSLAEGKNQDELCLNYRDNYINQIDKFWRDYEIKLEVVAEEMRKERERLIKILVMFENEAYETRMSR